MSKEVVGTGKVVGRGETCLSFHNVTLRHRSLRENCLFIAILSTAAGQQASLPDWLPANKHLVKISPVVSCLPKLIQICQMLTILIYSF